MVIGGTVGPVGRIPDLQAGVGARDRVLHRAHVFLRSLLKESCCTSYVPKTHFQMEQLTFLSHLMTKPTKWMCAERRLRSACASA